MRKLAAAVRVEAMSLYNHVANKEDVLDGLTGLFFTKIEIPQPTDDWAEDLASLGVALRAATRAYPKTATLALTREAVSDSGVAATAATLDILHRAGFDTAEAVQAMRAMMSFQIGALLRELAHAPTLGATRDEQDARAELLKHSDFAVVVEAAEPLAALDFDREYEYGLYLVVSSIKFAASQRSGSA